MKDVYGKDLSGLKEKKLFLFDMDGTIYCENTLFDGVVELLARIKQKGGDYVFITNNPTRSVQEYVQKLQKMGITAVNEQNFFTSAQATAMIMKEKFGDKLIYAQGTRSFISDLKAAGLTITEEFTDQAAAILVSFDLELTMEKLRTTSKMLTLFDLPYFATNPDWVCPVDFGYVPDCGAMCKSLEYATGKWPTFFGKPEPTMALVAMKKFNRSQAETVVIGDRLYTDIASGVNAGVDTVCVLSGEVKKSEVDESDIKPTYLLQSVKDMDI